MLEKMRHQTDCASNDDKQAFVDAAAKWDLTSLREDHGEADKVEKGTGAECENGGGE